MNAACLTTFTLVHILRQMQIPATSVFTNTPEAVSIRVFCPNCWFTSNIRSPQTEPCNAEPYNAKHCCSSTECYLCINTVLWQKRLLWQGNGTERSTTLLLGFALICKELRGVALNTTPAAAVRLCPCGVCMQSQLEALPKLYPTLLWAFLCNKKHMLSVTSCMLFFSITCSKHTSQVHNACRVSQLVEKPAIRKTASDLVRVGSCNIMLQPGKVKAAEKLRSLVMWTFKQMLRQIVLRHK